MSNAIKEAATHYKSGFAYSSCGLFSENIDWYKSLEKQEVLNIFIEINRYSIFSRCYGFKLKRGNLPSNLPFDGN